MPTALIVEDEPEANQLLAMLVRLRGFQTESAFTGEEALSKVGHARPDIMFLDLMLPDITGYDVCSSLKSRRATNGIPIVMVTARLADENRRKGFRLGANEYIPKPYTPDQIFRAIADADVWRKGIDDRANEGGFALESDGEVAAFRQLSDLRSFLLARSKLEEEGIGLIGQSLTEVVQRGLDWGRRRKTPKVGTLSYRLDPDALVITIRDESGWFRDDHPDENGLAKAIAQGKFGRVEHEAAGTTLTLVSHGI